MPPHSYSTTQEANSSRKRDEAAEDNDSTKTRRGSPTPPPSDDFDQGHSSVKDRKDKTDIDNDLLGFGAQFNDKK
ncbi:hypothetical protein F5B19DRAFT_498674 [Rostrohypoxylon terebratum]|nr:hypothetical protein F5B19DRAFT_498674 [Rostrohypoxylon terebratum]